MSYRSSHQERISNPSRTIQFMKHADTPLYLLNTHSIHNYAHIKNILPATLRDLSPVVLESSIPRVHAQAVAHMKARKDAAASIPLTNIPATAVNSSPIERLRPTTPMSLLPSTPVLNSAPVLEAQQEQINQNPEFPFHQDKTKRKGTKRKHHMGSASTYASSKPENAMSGSYSHDMVSFYVCCYNDSNAANSLEIYFLRLLFFLIQSCIIFYHLRLIKEVGTIPLYSLTPILAYHHCSQAQPR
jgi:hypothetical protein